jgi:hypothetical protein
MNFGLRNVWGATAHPIQADLKVRLYRLPATSYRYQLPAASEPLPQLEVSGDCEFGVDDGR